MQNEIEEAIEALKANRPQKRKTTPVYMSEYARRRYIEVHRAWQLKKFPNAVNDHGYVSPKMPTKDANGLQNFMENVFNWQGHHLERHSIMGVPIVKNGQPVLTASGKPLLRKGGGTLGSADTTGHFVSKNHKFPIPIKPEIKINSDRQSEDQKRFEAKMNATGAIYTIIRDFDDVWKFYDYLNTL